MIMLLATWLNTATRALLSPTHRLSAFASSVKAGNRLPSSHCRRKKEQEEREGNKEQKDGGQAAIIYIDLLSDPNTGLYLSERRRGHGPRAIKVLTVA